MNSKKQLRKKRFQRDPTVNLRVTDRDREIIKLVYQHRFLSSEHLVSLAEGSKQRILRRLHLLFHAGYLDRPQRQLTAFGYNHSIIYGLGNRGGNLLASDLDLPIETVDWSRKNRDAKDIFLKHTLMVSRIMTAFRLACWKKDGVEFIESDRLIKNRQKPPSIKIHALSWRVNIKRGDHGQRRNLSFNMIPDNVFGLRIRNNNAYREQYFFLEADRSTMPVRRTNFYRSSFYKKMLGYIASYKNELFSEYFGFKKVRVLTVTKSDKRIKNMIKLNKDLHDLRNGYNLFLFARDETIKMQMPERIFERIWINGQGRKVSLLS